MDHAIRFTADCTQESYLWPARHEAGQDNSSCPPMGARFRLNASFTLPASQCSAFCQTVLTTMKTYGLILADNGSNWYFQGTADRRWTYTEVDQLKAIPAESVRGGRRVLSHGQSRTPAKRYSPAAPPIRPSVRRRPARQATRYVAWPSTTRGPSKVNTSFTSPPE